MSQRQLKTGYFLLAGLNSFATVFYLYYLYFYTQTAFGFGNKANLTLAAFNGLLYMAGSFWCGHFAQKFGYFTALKLGFFIMLAAFSAGTQLGSATGQVVVMAVMVIGMCFTWPALEALVTEDESPAGVQHMVGIYNLVWAGTGALAYFFGGAILEYHLQRLFYVPIAVQFIQLGLTFWLQKNAMLKLSAGDSVGPELHLNPRPIAKAKMFLRMSWLANPFAYIAINTLVAVMPSVSKQLGLSTMLAGFCCSVWCFARLTAFLALWCWSGWHYRFKWLLGAYLLLMATFSAVILAPNVAILVLAQIVFGVALGLIYYSSLFYSMDLSQSKGMHGGIHEAAIGLGNFAGPAVGAASLHFLPQYAGSGPVAVTCLLFLGLAGLLWLKSQIPKGT